MTHWLKADQVRPILPDLIGYSSLYEMIVRKENRQNKLLSLFIEILVSLHPQVADGEFQIGTEIPA